MNSFEPVLSSVCLLRRREFVSALREHVRVQLQPSERVVDEPALRRCPGFGAVNLNESSSSQVAYEALSRALALAPLARYPARAA